MRKSSDPQRKSDIVELLHFFRMYFFQVYPEKTARFLDYCSFLKSASKNHTVSELLSLDAELHSLYCTSQNELLIQLLFKWHKSRYNAYNSALFFSHSIYRMDPDIPANHPHWSMQLIQATN